MVVVAGQKRVFVVTWSFGFASDYLMNMLFARQPASACLLLTEAVRLERFSSSSSLLLAQHGMSSGWSFDVTSWTSMTTTSLRYGCRYASVDLTGERASRSETLLVTVDEVGRKAGKAESELAHQLMEKLIEIEKEIKQGQGHGGGHFGLAFGKDGGGARTALLLAIYAEAIGVLQVWWPGQLLNRLLSATDQNLAATSSEWQNQGTPSPGDNGTLGWTLAIPLLLDSEVIVFLVPLPIWQKSTCGEHMVAAIGSIPVRRAKKAPLRPGSVAAAGGKLAWTHARRSREKPSRTSYPGKLTMTDGSKIRIKKVISCGAADVRRMNLNHPRIETGGAQPVRFPPRRLPPSKQDTVEVAEREREKTAFSPSMGLLRFWVILFGLWNAPTTFQRNGKSTEGPNRTEEEHLECLKGVLSRLQSVELNIKHEKWQLMLSAKLLLVVCPEFRRRGNCVARLYKERCEVTLGAEGGRGVHLLEGCAGCSGLLRDANEDASPSLGYSPLLMISVRQEAKRPENPEDHPQLSNGGHLGVAKAVSRLSHQLQSPMQLQLMSHPFQQMAMDIVGPLEDTQSGNQQIQMAKLFLHNKGIIPRVTYLWVSSTPMVPQTFRGWRLCGNYRSMNKVATSLPCLYFTCLC
ncbi:hypothetical protein T4E_6670 [Trichinella pseudospiralis]|uniref:Uncharacterized protein n=1 Tax=Trichinella pseudospiralis TaxID=6337 RepID=A0A0V0XGE2_TRIPS|nr:hypothetical protein T4E_6670 [Trichinella pseudospiralis]